MITNKIKLKKYFDNACHSYETVADVQKKSAEFLIQKLREFHVEFYPTTVLDLGTGTGYIPEMLVKHYPKSSYLLNDLAPQMIAKCRSKFKQCENFKFCTGDMETMAFENYCLITSNFSFQWADNLWEVLEKFYKKSAVFAFSGLLQGTFKEWQAILNCFGLVSVLKVYPSEQEIRNFCQKLVGQRSFFFQSHDFQLKFSNAGLFMKYLKNLGAGFSDKNIPMGVLKHLMSTHHQEFFVTYKIFFAILKK